MENTSKYKYNEDKSIRLITDYVNGTYGQHYVGNGDVQTVDFWQSLGSLETTSRDTAIKYLARYGKKGGKNRKDLLKAVHYIILMMYALDLEEQAGVHDEIITANTDNALKGWVFDPADTDLVTLTVNEV